ncbi:MAG TPA: transglutaminase domain-containing protein [Patescibacteria group bacterium]|nr:transglutaminase domain-containing protein [Patescibacteria group bacterium]
MSSGTGREELPSVLALAKQTSRVRPNEELTDPIAQYPAPLLFNEVSSEPGAVIKAESGGFTAEKRHLKAMEGRIEVCAYEPLQNLSYGLGSSPPPAVVFGLKDGSRVVYDGNPSHAPPHSKIAYQSFVTSGEEGITTSTSVLPIHRDQKHNNEDAQPALGFFGEGLKNAVTFLLTKFDGTRVEINSLYTHAKTHKKHMWVGRYGMQDTSDGSTQVLGISYVEVDKDRVSQTSTTIYNPPESFYTATVESPNTFLFMNPNYRGGVFVPGSRDFESGVKFQALVEGLGMEVLDTDLLFGLTTDKPVGFGFMDGQKFDLAHETYFARDKSGEFFFTWHFVGGLEETTSWDAQICRGRDSAEIEGLDKLPALLRVATNSGYLDKDFWLTLFEKMANNAFEVSLDGDTLPDIVVPYEIHKMSYNSHKFDNRGEKVIKEAWGEFIKLHPEIRAVTSDIDHVNDLRQERGKFGVTDAPKVIMLHGLYGEIKAICGKLAPDADDLTRSDIVKAIENAPPLETIKDAVVATLQNTSILNIETAFLELGKNYEHVDIHIDQNDHTITLIFDSTQISPAYIPKIPTTALFNDDRLMEIITSISVAAKDDSGAVKIIRKEFNGIEVTLNIERTNGRNEHIWKANGAVRTMTYTQPRSTLEARILVDAKNFKQIAGIAEEKSNEGRRIKIESITLAQNEKTQLQQALAEEKNRASNLERQLHNLIEQVKGDPSFRRDAIVQHALHEAEQKQRELDLLRRKQRIDAKEALELNLSELFNLRSRVWKIATRAAAGVGVYVLTKDVIIAWATNSTALLNGLIEINNTVTPVSKGLSVSTLFGLNEVVSIPQQLQLDGLGLNWSIHGNELLLDAGNDARQININAVLAPAEAMTTTPDRTIQSKIIPLVHIEGPNPSVDTAGYFYTSYVDSLTVVRGFDGGFVQGTYTGKHSYQERTLPFGRPSNYLLRQVYTPAMPDRSWTPISPRVGEMPIGFAGVESATFRQNQMTGTWEVDFDKSSSDSLVVYTGPADEQALRYLQRPPADADSESLLDMDTLRPDIRNAILAAKNSNLTDDQKIEEGLNIWRKIYRYDSVANKDNFPQTNTKLYVSAMINEGIGPCGYAALGAVAILREIGIPTNAVGGFLNEQFGGELSVDEMHAWIIAWSGTAKSWKYFEPQNGQTTTRYAEEKGQLVGQAVQTVTRDPKQTTTTLPVSINFHASDDPNPLFASLIDDSPGAWSTYQTPSADITKEQQIASLLKSEEQKNKAWQIVGNIAPLVVTAIAPSFVDFLRLLIAKKKKIAGEVDTDIAEEKKQAL